MTLEACGAGSNHQSYERLQLDNGASYRNVVSTIHVHTISLNLVLSKKMIQDDPLTPKMGNMVCHKIDYFHWSARFTMAFFEIPIVLGMGKLFTVTEMTNNWQGLTCGYPKMASFEDRPYRIIRHYSCVDLLRQQNATWCNIVEI